VTDIVDAETRSRMMSQIKNRDTGPEMLLRRSLWNLGVRGYRCNYGKAPGRPDVAFVGRRLAVFVDGAFWHGHPDHFTFGKSGEAWDAKIRRNIERDREVNSALFEAGWTVVRFWDFEIKADPGGVAAKVGHMVEGLASRQEVTAAEATRK
jgi:DNA mismatch endonuclease, patch repair protein